MKIFEKIAYNRCSVEVQDRVEIHGPFISCWNINPDARKLILLQLM